MRRRKNPLVVAGMAAVIVLAFVVAYFIKRMLPDSVGGWKNLIYWLVVTGIDLSGGFAVGKIFGKRR